MEEARPPVDRTRKALKVFGVTVTSFEERARVLLARARQASAGDERETVRAESAQLVADLHHALQEIQGHVYQLQSDFLMELVVRDRAAGPPPG
ncbi:MAG: hypothetical protein E6J00_10115 [Chloroflexi bacterium]|nr:MAG: hypothetical protein E6J00_10115 [Chloroflexota bacterium]